MEVGDAFKHKINEMQINNMQNSNQDVRKPTLNASLFTSELLEV